MSLVIHAPNIHQGGGRTLLLPLLAAVKQPCTALVDARLAPLTTLSPELKLVPVQPTLSGRLRAEWQLHRLCQPGDKVLCFGNLPPLLPNAGTVYVYLQTRYLAQRRALAGLPLQARLRLLVERIWLRSRLGHARLLVQTESMEAEVRHSMQRHSIVLPFAPTLALPQASGEKQHDFIYVASGEPHKNHRRLVEAWAVLASRGLRPSLCLTLHPLRDAALLAWVQEQASRHGLDIDNQRAEHDAIARLYASGKALIYPSLFESFGLPLLEASAAGLPIVAAERDYVRNVVDPVASFDPESALSIARAVMRQLGYASPPPAPPDASTFLQQLEALD